MKFLILLLLTTLTSAAALRIEKGEQSLKVLDGEELLTEYRTDSKVPYLYPLKSPKGAILSRHWPVEPDFKGEEQDHPHHRSMWLSHGLVNGFDFWTWKGKGDPRIIHRGFSDAAVEDSTARFTVSLEWTAGGEVQLREKRTYILRKHDHSTEIEVHSALEAAAPEILFGDTKEGFFALRVDRTLRAVGPDAKGHIIDGEGRTDGDCWGKRANWAALYGPDESGQAAVIAMMDHPSNLRHPTWWHVRDYGLLAANPLGAQHFEGKNAPSADHLLKRGEVLALRYLVILHQGSLESAKLAERWSSFSKTLP
jgi:hypothetical protein